MLRSQWRGYAAVVSVGLMTGLGGCLVIGGGAEGGNDAVCVVDYDECLDLGVDAGICEAIYEACEGNDGGEEGGTDGGDDGMGCWDEVQQCLEDNNGDEEQCADIIQWCQGNEDGDDDNPGDDGDSCWDEVQWCYESMEDPAECEALAEMCQGADAGDEGGNNCEEILEQCGIEPGAPPPADEEIPAECWEAYEQCLGGDDGNGCQPGDPTCCDPAPGECCDGDLACQCEEQYNWCEQEGGSKDECAAQYQQCVAGGDDGDPPDDNVCWELADLYCQVNGEDYEGQPENGCELFENTCEQGDPNGCVENLFSCNDLMYGDTQGLLELSDNGDGQWFECTADFGECIQ